MTNLHPRTVRQHPEPAGFPIAEELQLVEQRLEQSVTSREERLSDIARYLVASGGKRVRPAVALLIFRACGGTQLDDIVDAAVALELIHSASLLHDDIIDGSDFRRGTDSALRKYGVADTLVTGDFLFSRAFQICGRFEERLINWAAQACISLTEGEILQARFRRNPTVTLADYMEIIIRKTASLFQQGARTGAYLAAADETTVESLAQCGFEIGITFQIVDDLLDVEGTEERTGKPVGIDLRDGNPSLPIVLAMREDSELRRLFEKRDLTASDARTALDRIRQSGVTAKIRGLASHHAEQALAATGVLPSSPYKTSLLALIDQLVERTS